MALKDALQKVQKKLGAEDLILTEKKNIEAISSGSVILDTITGGGLLFKGRITEISGKESSGKTTLSIQSAVEALEAGKQVVVFDFEQTFDVDYAKKLGIDFNNENFAVVQPYSLEEGIEILHTLEKEMPDNGGAVLIFDSIAAMKPKELLEKAGEQQRIGLHAQRIGELTSYLNSVWCGKKKAYILVTNQIRRIPAAGGMFQAKALKDNGLGFGVSNDTSFTTTGGDQLKYLLSVRVLLDFAGKVEEGSWNNGDLTRTGNFVKAFTIKNKLVPPFRTAKIAIIYGEGTSDEFAIIEVLKANGWIESKGSTLYYYDSDNNDTGYGLSFKAVGKEKFYKQLKQPEYQDDMRKIYESIMNTTEAAVIADEDGLDDEIDEQEVE